MDPIISFNHLGFTNQQGWNVIGNPSTLPHQGWQTIRPTSINFMPQQTHIVKIAR